MSDLSKKARTLIDDVTSETTSAWDEYGLSPAEYDLWQAVDPMRSTGIYKPHGDGPSLLASLCDEIEALEKENAALRAALGSLKIRGECWCEMAIDNPMMRGHSASCDAARKVYGDAPVDPKSYPPEKP